MNLQPRNLLDDNPMVGKPRKGTFRYWTSPELKILAENFPDGGIAACLPLLPGRTASSIYQRANIDGLIRKTKRGPVPRQKWFSNPQIDAVIIRTYQKAPERNDINRLAKTVNRPRYWVSQRAVRLGLVIPRFKEPPWSEPEIEIATAMAAKVPRVIQRALAVKGFVRTPSAIMVKLKRLGTGTGKNADIDHYSGRSLAKLFGVDDHVITAWIKKGWLKAGKRGTARTEKQGGDEWQIHRRHVRTFIIDNAAAVDLRKVDRFWFIELLVNGAAP